MVQTLLSKRRAAAHRTTQGSSRVGESLEGSEKNRRLKWKADLEKHCITTSFDRRNWERTDDGAYYQVWAGLYGFHTAWLMAHVGEHWNIYWASVYSTKLIFNGEAGRVCVVRTE